MLDHVQLFFENAGHDLTVGAGFAPEKGCPLILRTITRTQELNAQSNLRSQAEVEEEKSFSLTMLLNIYLFSMPGLL